MPRLYACKRRGTESGVRVERNIIFGWVAVESKLERRPALKVRHRAAWAGDHLSSSSVHNVTYPHCHLSMSLKQITFV